MEALSAAICLFRQLELAPAVRCCPSSVPLWSGVMPPVSVCWLALLLPLAGVVAHNNGVALTPAMGWNTWNKFHCTIGESLIKTSADLLVSSGLAQAGYVYVNLDDCWQAAKRTADGRITPNSERFPSGMKALSEYLHSAGLLFGIYSDSGSQTCAGLPGSRGYEQQDATTYTEWEVDYLKVSKPLSRSS